MICYAIIIVRRHPPPLPAALLPSALPGIVVGVGSGVAVAGVGIFGGGCEVAVAAVVVVGCCVVSLLLLIWTKVLVIAIRIDVVKRSELSYGYCL